MWKDLPTGAQREVSLQALWILVNSDCHGARYREEGAVGAHEGCHLSTRGADSAPVFTAALIVRGLLSSPHSEQLLTALGGWGPNCPRDLLGHPDLLGTEVSPHPANLRGSGAGITVPNFVGGTERECPALSVSLV